MAFRRIELPIQWVPETARERAHRQLRLDQIDRLLGAIEDWNAAPLGDSDVPEDLLHRFRRLRHRIEAEYGTQWYDRALVGHQRIRSGADLHEAALDLEIPLMRKATGPEFAIGSYVARVSPSAPADSGMTQAG